MQPQFTIVRDDLLLDPLTIITDGLLIGRLKACELLLNHPSVSRVQAGIKAIEGDYYIFNLRPANPPILNGRAVEQNEALAAGDVLEVGPFAVEVDRPDQGLLLRVTLRIGVTAVGADLSSPNIATEKLEPLTPPDGARKKRAPRPAPLPGTKALDIFWDKRIREAGKMVRPSALFPRGQRRTGKAAFNWMPTSDLKRKWPASFFIWAIVIVAAGSAGAAFLYANAFAPAPVSEPHARHKLQTLPAIARQPNANSCTACHSLRKTVEENCTACHQAEGFTASVIQPHRDAGIGCVACHAEHQGAAFRPRDAAFTTCTACHNDLNEQAYNGRTVGTPHSGTRGYPVVDTEWKWKGIDSAEWALKQIAVTRLPADNENAWRSKQFHALHMYRVRAPEGLPGNEKRELSCSSCHKSFDPIDRETPGQTCARCHNGQIDSTTGRTLVAADKPNCISCHVQHPKDNWRWNSSLMAN
jgi:hypothetical protein